MKGSQNVTEGVSFSALLGLLFIGLKLSGHIAWSWWWVLAPFWVWWAIVLVIAAFVFVAEVTS